MKTEQNTELVRNDKGQFTAGNQEGNRNGRPPKNKHIPDILRQIGEELTGEKDITRLESLCRKVFEHAEKGIRWAVEWVANRLEGNTSLITYATSKAGTQGAECTLQVHTMQAQSDVVGVRAMGMHGRRLHT